MLLVITPFINDYITDKSLLEILNATKNMSGAVILGIILIIVYVWLKRGEK